jgi:hypothetical protein
MAYREYNRLLISACERSKTDGWRFGVKPLIIIVVIGLVSPVFASQMFFIDDVEKGTLTVKDGKMNVLTYRYGDQLKEGIEPKQTRSCYIHPLYSLDGKILTEDFPEDHLHHHGITWTWPVVKTRGQTTQTWHPANLRQYFVRWLKREAKKDRATLKVENSWKLDGREVVAREIVTLYIHPVADNGRAIDLELTIEAVGGPLEISGTQDQNKGYGGLTLRSAPEFKGLPIKTDQGEITGEKNNMSLRWADLSTNEMGVAIFVSPDHPDFPATWVLRTSYAGLLNVSWPGLKPAILQPRQPISLRYRVFVHKGDTSKGQVEQAYQRYIAK